MQTYKLSPLFLFRERLRSNLREFLRYWFGCSVMVALLNGWLDTAYLASHSVALIFIVSAMFGVPIGLACLLFFRFLRFVFNR